jgi:hypothetical protein
VAAEAPAVVATAAPIENGNLPRKPANTAAPTGGLVPTASPGGTAAVPEAPKPAPPIVLPVERLDTVYLANGGRVRGLVTEESPNEGVVMRLLDGSERRYPRGEVILVQYGNGTLSVQSKGDTK